MDKSKKYFGGLEMTWVKVIIFAVVTAVVTALLNVIPALKDTSFTDIAVYLDCWIVFALLIITNCKKWYEASLKCFVFFLISQPLIYLIEAPFIKAGLGVFHNYGWWFIMTVLTLPGAAIAFQLRKKNWLSVLILAVATCYYAYMAGEYMMSMLFNFPRHLLSMLFCIAAAIFFIFLFLDDKKHRAVALALAALTFAGCVFIGTRGYIVKVSLDEGDWSYTLNDDSIVAVKIDDDNRAKIRAKRDGTTYICFEDENGKKREYDVTVSGGQIWLSSYDDEAYYEVSGSDVVSDSALE